MQTFQTIDIPKLPIDIIKVARKNHEGKRCYVFESGAVAFYPSVTTVLGCRGKKAIYEWRQRVGAEKANEVSRVAAGTGTQIHTLSELYLDGQDITKKLYSVSPEAKLRFKKFTETFTKINGIYFQEKPVISKILGVGGTIDLFGVYDGEISIIDFKTSKRYKKEEDIMSYFAQCYAYSQAVYEMYGITCTKCVILMSCPDGNQVFVKDINHGKDFFLESLRMYHNGEID